MVLSALTFAASAQVWIAGDISFSTYGSKRNAEEGIELNPKSINFGFSPEVGYNINDKFAVAAEISFSYGYAHSEGYYSGDKHVIKSNSRTNTFSISPFVRYTFADWGNLRAFVDGGIGLSTSHLLGSGNSHPLYFDVFARPGLSYALNDRLGLVAHFGSINYQHGSIDSGRQKSNSFHCGLASDIAFGVYLNL